MALASCLTAASQQVVAIHLAVAVSLRVQTSLQIRCSLVPPSRPPSRVSEQTSPTRLLTYLAAFACQPSSFALLPLSSTSTLIDPPHNRKVTPLTKEKRQQLRKLLINLQPLAPAGTASQARSNGKSLSDNEREAYHAEVDVAVRWNTFLVHTSLNLPELVSYVSNKHKVNEEEHQRALAKAIKSHTSFKTTTCENLQVHAASLIRADPKLSQLNDAALGQKIGDSLNPDKFFAAFSFLKDFLNYEGCAPLGKWFIKTIYTNMVLRLLHSSRTGSEPDGWDKILNTFEMIALVEAYDAVDITDFSQLTSVYRSRKEQQKQLWTAIKYDWVSIGPAPAKQQPAAPSDGPTAYEVAVDSFDPITPEERLRYYSGDGLWTKRQQGMCPPFVRGTLESTPQQTIDNESDFSSNNLDIHSNDGVWIAEADEDTEEEQAVAWDDDGFGVDVESDVGTAKLDGDVEEEQIITWFHGGGYGHDLDDEDVGVEKAKKGKKAQKAKKGKKARAAKKSKKSRQ